MTLTETGSRPASTRPLLRGLPEVERRVITMALHRGMSCREIAASMGVSPLTVGGWMRSGLSRLAGDLAGAGPADPAVDRPATPLPAA